MYVITSLNYVLFLNAMAGFAVVDYVISLIEWFRPETVVGVLVSRAEHISTNEDRLGIVWALEELAGKAIQRGYSGTVRSVLDAYLKITKSYCMGNPELNSTTHTSTPDHPLRELPDSLERLAIALQKNNMGNMLYHLAPIFHHLGVAIRGWSQEGFAGVSLAIALRHIVGHYLRQGDDTEISNLVAEPAWLAWQEDDEWKTTWYFDDLVRPGVVHSNPTIVGLVLDGLLQCLAKDNAPNQRDVETVLEECLDGNEELLSMQGYFSELPIGKQIQELLSALSARTP